MHPGFYNRLPIIAALANSQAPRGPIVASPLAARYSSPSKVFGRVMSEALLTRQDRPQTLAGRRQEFPRYRPLRSVADAQLSSLMHRSGLGRTYRRASVPSAGKGRRSSRGEVERYFQTGSSRGRPSRRDPSAFDNLIAKSAFISSTVHTKLPAQALIAFPEKPPQRSLPEAKYGLFPP